ICGFRSEVLEVSRREALPFSSVFRDAVRKPSRCHFGSQFARSAESGCWKVLTLPERGSSGQSARWWADPCPRPPRTTRSKRAAEQRRRGGHHDGGKNTQKREIAGDGRKTRVLQHELFERVHAAGEGVGDGTRPHPLREGALR